MTKVISYFIFTLFLFSYNDFIIDGNNTQYGRLDNIVNTTEDKVYLAIGYKPDPSTDKDLVRIDASGANIIISKVEEIDTIDVEKMLSLKDEDDKYIGEFILAGADPNGARLEHFEYDGTTYNLISGRTYTSVSKIADIVQKEKGGDLYFVTRSSEILNDDFSVTDPGTVQAYDSNLSIYDGYLGLGAGEPTDESYLAEIDRTNGAELNLKRFFSYNLDGAGDVNVTAAIEDTFFTLGFNSGGNISIIGSSPFNNQGTKFIALNVNASIIDANTIKLTAPKLIEPGYTLLEGQPKDTVAKAGSIITYGPEYNETNTEHILIPGGEVVSVNATSVTMLRAGNISELTQGYYNVSLGAPYDKVINWLDVNCTVKNPKEKYIIPWTEAQIQALTGTLTNRGFTDYELCRTNDKFLYKEHDANITLIKKRWQFIYEDELPILWMQSIPNSKLTGNIPKGRIETITTDNTSIALITQDNATLGGINLFRIEDSTLGAIANRVKWHKIYGDGTDVNNTATITLNGPNLLKTRANDFVLAGKIEDDTRINSKKYDCMIIKFDKNGNELWTKNLGGFHNDNCYSVALEKNNTSPFYNDYVAVGNSGTRNEDDDNDSTSYGVKFRDEGTLLHLSDGWSLITNGTDRSITAQGKKEESNTMGITNLGAYKSYFQFIKNQWLINQYPIEPLSGFWIYTIDGRHDIFLEGNLLEQKFSGTDLGWVLLGTGVQLVNTKRKFNLEALWKFKSGKWIENPTEINPGEGFWAKKKK